MQLAPQRLFLLHRGTELITVQRSQRRGTVKGRLDPEAIGSFRQFGLLLPRLLKTGSKGGLLLSENVAAADAVACSSPGFRGSLSWSSLSMPI